MKTWIIRLWHRFLAMTRIDLDAVCRLSEGRGLVDFHDYMDSEHGYPDHFSVLKCKRCGKQFTI